MTALLIAQKRLQGDFPCFQRAFASHCVSPESPRILEEAPFPEKIVISKQ
jgi:hypothetical protein